MPTVQQLEHVAAASALLNGVLGETFQDALTGYEGIAVTITVSLHAAPRVELQAIGLTSEGKPIASQWFDFTRLVWADPRPPDARQAIGVC